MANWPGARKLQGHRPAPVAARIFSIRRLVLAPLPGAAEERPDEGAPAEGDAGGKPADGDEEEEPDEGDGEEEADAASRKRPAAAPPRRPAKARTKASAHQKARAVAVAKETAKAKGAAKADAKFGGLDAWVRSGSVGAAAFPAPNAAASKAAAATSSKAQGAALEVSSPPRAKADKVEDAEGWGEGEDDARSGAKWKVSAVTLDAVKEMHYCDRCNQLCDVMKSYRVIMTKKKRGRSSGASCAPAAGCN